MNVFVIEDESPAARRIIKLLNEIIPEATIEGPADSVAESIQWLQNNPAPDLIISDIELSDGQSFEIFQQVTTESPIVFTTAYDQFAIKAFKLNSIDYLLKPIDPEELKASINKYKSLNKPAAIDINQLQSMLGKQDQYKERFMVKIGEKILSVPTEEAAFFYSADKATFLQTIEGRKYLIDYPLEQLELMLDPKLFFRLNRKYITHLNAIDEIISYSNSRLKIKLKNHQDNDILISRDKVQPFKSWLDS